jgi:hypothetical protein
MFFSTPSRSKLEEETALVADELAHLFPVVETDFGWKAERSATISIGFVAEVRISKAGTPVAVFSPLRFGESPGKPFHSEADALMGGYSAGRRIVDDLFTL